MDRLDSKNRAQINSSSELEELKNTIVNIQKDDLVAALDQANIYYQQANKLNNQEHQINATYLLGYIHMNMSQYIDAIKFFTECTEHIESKEDPFYFKSNNALGLVHKLIGEPQKALFYYNIALEGASNLYLSTIYNNISILYRDLNELDKAIEYANMAYDYTINVKSEVEALSILMNLASYKLLQKKYDEAETIYSNLKEVATKNNLPTQVINADLKIAHSKFEQHKFNDALVLLLDIEKASIANNYKLQLFDIKQLMALTYTKLMQDEKAIDVYEELLTDKEDVNNYHLVTVLSNYIDLLESKEDFKKSSALYKELLHLKELIYQKEKDSNLFNSKLRLENKEQELQINNLKEIKVLNKILEEKTILLNQEQKKLEETNNDLMHFSYALSHDLKEPVRMVKGFTDILHFKMKNKLTEEEAELFDNIKNGTLKIAALIHELQQYAKLGVTEDMKKEQDLNEIVNDVLYILKNSIQETNTLIHISTLPIIKTYPVLINQLFQNIISNSIKYRQESVSPIIHIDYNQNEYFDNISIQDNGIGIPLKEQDKVFSLFRRASNHDIVDGTGVGLAFCMKIINKMNGKMELVSKGENQGTKFILSFPRK